jgi:NADH-quinone oxidoreductase subunit G
VADVVLPAAAWLEKPGTFVNMEGRVQRSLRAVFPPGDAREDWTILRALAERLGIRLPYDDLAALRSRIEMEWPHLGAPGFAPVPWVAPDAAGLGLPAGPTRKRSAGYYQSNPVLRASPTMAACVREIVEGRRPPLLEAAE